MANCIVTCVTKVSHPNPREGITHLGGHGWYWTRRQVIESIEAKTNTFFTQVNGQTAYLVVVDGPNGKYLRTHADNDYHDNLLYLPICSGR